MKKTFLAALAALALAVTTASAQEAKPKFYLEDGKVVEKFEKIDATLRNVKGNHELLKADHDALRREFAELTKTVADLMPGKTRRAATSEPTAPCVCGSECKCEAGKCPGGCPTKSPEIGEVSYADAFAAAAKGEKVTVFYGVSPAPVAGKWTWSPVIPAHGPGRYETEVFKGAPAVRLVSAPTACYAAGVCIGGSCSGGR